MLSMQTHIFYIKCEGRMSMYFIVGCTEKKTEDNSVIVKSNLYDSEIKLSDENFKKEYYLLKKIGCKDLKTILEQELNRQGILLDQNEVKEKVSEIKAYFDRVLVLTIMPTEACNFRCVYCYEDHENITMKTDIVVGIERFLEKNYAKYNHISISWFGGEPTLCKDIVLRINRLIKSLVDNDKSKYTFTMTTNGYLLDEQSFLEYYDSGIVSYQITLDGWNHDKKRLLKNGQPTLKKIIENLDAIHKLPDTYKFNIMIRNNILAGDRDFSWYDFLNEKYGEDVRFGILVRQVCDLGGEGVKSLDLLHAITGKKLIKDHINYIDNLKIRCDNTGNIGLGNEMCYASYKNGFTIRASGKVEKCTVALNKSQNEVGYIDGYGNLHLDLKKNEVWSENILYDKCFSCNKIFSCLNNMCPFKRIMTENYICDNYQSFEDEG